MVVLDYLIPAEEKKAEIIVRKSTFISTISPVFSIDDAKQFIDRIRRQYPDASHHVPAYIIGSGATTVMHCSDAGEPPGTAGRPILAVLKGSKLGDVALVVTRYFGGIKLGTGGLVRAYTDAAQAVLESLPRAKKILVCKVIFTVSYSILEKTRRLISSHQGAIEEESFSSEISITAIFPVDNFDLFKSGFSQLTNGSKSIMIVDTYYSLSAIF